MDDDLCRIFFAEPSCPAQRQYEAIRAVFVVGLSQKEAAERFGYSQYRCGWKEVIRIQRVIIDSRFSFFK